VVSRSRVFAFVALTKDVRTVSCCGVVLGTEMRGPGEFLYPWVPVLLDTGAVTEYKDYRWLVVR